MNVMGVLEPIINRDNSVPGDYTGEDGMLHCGKCGEPKQMRGEGALKGMLLPVTCSCQTREQAAKEERERRAKIEALRAKCLPVKAMHGHTFDSASEEKHILIARRYVEKWEDVCKNNYGLLLWGNTGTGKSFTAHCIANALIDRGIPVLFYSATEIVARLMDWERRDETMQKVRSAQLMILDDIGAERDTSSAREQLCAVIDERIESGKPLVVTTNYTLGEMKDCEDRAQQRIFDRLKPLVHIAITGESRRREIGAQKLRDARELFGL